jgi:hypothetical protein
MRQSKTGYKFQGRLAVLDSAARRNLPILLLVAAWAWACTPSSRNSGPAARAAGVGSYRELLSGKTTTFDLHDTSGVKVGSFTAFPLTGQYRKNRNYLIDWGGRAIQVSIREDLTWIEIRDEYGGVSTWQHAARSSWRLSGGSACVLDSIGEQLNVLGHVIGDLGKESPQAVVGSVGTDLTAVALSDDGGGKGSGTIPGVGCTGQWVTGKGRSHSKVISQARARMHADSLCQKSSSGRCPGCCIWGAADGNANGSATPAFACACVKDDFLCYCEVYGRACGS